MRAEIGNKNGLTIGEIIEMSGCVPKNIDHDCKAQTVTAFALDSREVMSGTMFVAMHGEHTDGHLYIDRAVEGGAVLTLAEHEVDGLTAPYIISTDGAEAALGRIASAYRSRFTLRSSAVTGSVGKTTTKEMIHTVLSQKYKTHRTEGNYNSTSGLPMSLMTLDDSFEASVWEMGMSARGEIEMMSTTARPDIAVITNIGISHIEMLGSRENIRDAKLEIRSGLPSDGKLILNGDEPLLSGIDGAIYASIENPNADYYADNITNTDGGMSFDVVSKISGRTRIELPMAGRHNILDSLYAFAVGEALGLCMSEIALGLKNYHTTGRRQHIYRHDGYTVIEDCYNAAPDSMKAALAVLRELGEKADGEKVAVLGDMRELGHMTEEMHRLVGREAQKSTDILFTFGKDAALIAEEAEKSGMSHDDIHVFTDITDVKDIGKDLADVLHDGDVVLFKASNSIALERVIEEIGAEYEDEK